MARRNEWEAVLAAELEQWAGKSWRQVLHDLDDGNVAYEVTHDSKTYQIEADLLENTPDYVHVSIAVDDGHLPESFALAAC